MNRQKCTLKVRGMICPQCEDEILPVLLHTRGILNADASYRKSSVSVEYDEDLIHADAFPALLEKCGYPAGGNGRSGMVSDLISAACVVLLFYLTDRITGLVKVPGTDTSVSAAALFFTGLLSGVHCIGMCGGIMLTQKNIFAYNGARLLGCTLTGAVFGALGSCLMYDTSTASMVKTISGLLVLLTGLNRWGIPFIRKFSLQLRFPCRTPGRTSFAVGLLNSLMPCGALTSVWLVSAASGSLLTGAVCMCSFCLGTLPCMLLFGCMGHGIPGKYKRYLMRGSTVIVTAMGLKMMVSGLY